MLTFQTNLTLLPIKEKSLKEIQINSKLYQQAIKGIEIKLLQSYLLIILYQ